MRHPEDLLLGRQIGHSFDDLTLNEMKALEWRFGKEWWKEFEFQSNPLYNNKHARITNRKV
jgi:hypothetical protein